LKNPNKQEFYENLSFTPTCSVKRAEQPTNLAEKHTRKLHSHLSKYIYYYLFKIFLNLIKILFRGKYSPTSMYDYFKIDDALIDSYEIPKKFKEKKINFI